MQYTALCCIAKDEDLFLREWIAYHALLGVEHFFIYDNCSAVPITTLLADWLPTQRIHVIKGEQEVCQKTAYEHCLEHFGQQFLWIAFLDVDEFISLPHWPDLRLFLAYYEPYAGLGLNWRMFGSNGHRLRPEGGVLANYTSYLYDDIHIKSIVQPRKTGPYTTPHSFLPNAGHTTVGADFSPIPPGFCFTVPHMEHACINHYYYKSEACFAHKIHKGNPSNIQRRMDEFMGQLDQPTQSDSSMLSRAAATQQALATGTLPTPMHITPAPAGELLASAQQHLSRKEYHKAGLYLCYASLQVLQEEETATATNNDTAPAGHKTGTAPAGHKAGTDSPRCAAPPAGQPTSASAHNASVCKDVPSNATSTERKASIWNMRAHLARCANAPFFATHALHQSLMLVANQQVYQEWAALLHSIHQPGKALAARNIANSYKHI